MTEQEKYANTIFLNAVLPLVKVVVNNDEKLTKKFAKTTATVQISALDEGIKHGTHFVIEEGEWTVVKGVIDEPTLELEFKTIALFNGFFKGTSSKLPKIIGLKNVGLLISSLGALMKMAKLLGMEKPPEDEETKRLLVKLMFYLLSSGISSLNKAGHPAISNWIKKSPDRVYSWRVEGDEDLSAFIRLKAGKSKASRGIYKRSKPFFTMRFDSTDSALGILMEIDDMIEATIKQKLVMEGAPEYGAQLGEYMVLVGSLAK
ncbi:MAG: hypothetical protein OCD02_02970 [Spirochaetaceae bacterium]